MESRIERDLPLNPDHEHILAQGDKYQLTPQGKVIADWFFELSRTRMQAIGLVGVPQPLQFSEIEAWSRIRGIKLGGWALSLLTLIDSNYLKQTIERINRESNK